MATQTAHESAQRGGYRRVFAVAEYRYVFAAHSITMLGSVIADVALSILVLKQTGSPFLSALVFGFAFIPYALSGTLLAGLSDRYPVRPLLVSCNAVSALLVAVMVLPQAPIWLLLALRFATSLILPIFASARVAGLADILGNDRYALGRSLLRIVNQSAQVCGFALGGLLLLAVDPRIVLFFNAISLACSALLLRFGTKLRPAKTAGDAQRRSLVSSSLRELSTLLKRPHTRSLMFLWWTAPALAGIPEGLAAPYAREIGSSSATVGFLMAAAAIGTVGAEVAVGTLTRPRQRSRLVIPMAMCSLIPLAVFAAKPAAPLAIILMGLTGAADCYMLGLDQWFLDSVPEELRGAAFSVNFSGIMLTQGLSISVAGALTQSVAPHLVIAGSALAGTILIAATCRTIVRSRPAPPH